MRLTFQHIHCSADTQTAQSVSQERSVQLFDDLNAFFNFQRSAVERDVIVFCMPPFHIGVEPMKCRTALILVLQALFGRRLPPAIDLNNAPEPKLRIRDATFLPIVLPPLPNSRLIVMTLFFIGYLLQ